MNERDYMVLEAMSVIMGVLSTFVLMIIFLFISPELLRSMFLFIAFIVMFSFILGVIFHYKRKMFIIQMERELEAHRKDFNGNGGQ